MAQNSLNLIFQKLHHPKREVELFLVNANSGESKNLPKSARQKEAGKL